MKKTNKTMYLFMAATSLLLILLCAGLWDVSGAAKSQHDGTDFPVYISEILTGNTRYPNADGLCCDYIELHNGGDAAIDLGGFQLSDGSKNKRYKFPSRTVLEPGDYLVVSCDSKSADSGYARFGLSRSGGETVMFLTSKGVVVQKVTTVEAGINQSMIPGGSGTWILADPTPGLPNDATALTLDYITPLRITEVMTAGSGSSFDWVELHNTSEQDLDISGFTLSDDISSVGYRFPQGTVIPGDGYLVVPCTDEMPGADIAPFSLSRQGGESLVVKTPEGRIADIMDTVAVSDGQSIALMDGTWQVTERITPGFANTEAGWEQYQTQTGAGSRTVIITEIMASNRSTLACSAGQFCDWVELKNNTDRAIHLSGWCLSDNPRDARKWELPDVTLDAGEYLLVFCSGSCTGEDLHAAFSLASDGETLILTAPGGTVSHSVTFTDAQADRSICIDHDTDEQTVTAEPTPGYANTDEGREAFCGSLTPRGALAIWEVMSSNDRYLPQSRGKCYDWAELRNISDVPVNLSDYAITDNPGFPNLAVLPNRILNPGEMTVVILSGDPKLTNQQYFHAGFSLNAGEDSLYLYCKDGTLADYAFVYGIPKGSSLGRRENAGGFYYMTPTPLGENEPGVRSVSSPVCADHAPGIYRLSAGETVDLSGSGQIYFTTGGQTPDVSSAVYAAPISVESSTVLRAVNVEEGKLPGDVYTATLLVNQAPTLPVVSIVTDPQNLWGADGLYRYTEETKDISFPANLSYSGDNGSFSIDCDLTTHGHSSLLKQDKKSFEVKFRNEYDGDLNFDVFGDGRVTSFHSLILRADQESTYPSFLRDNLMSAVARDACPAVISQNYRYVALYLNGEYWGIYSIREHHSAYHYAMHCDVPPSAVTVTKHYVDPATTLGDVKEYCEKTDLSDPESYAFVASCIDISSFIDWMVLESYAGNFDINGNVRYYYDSVSGLWRIGLVDMDLGMFRTTTFASVMDCYSHSVIFNALLKNPEFQDAFLTRLAQLLSGPLSDDAMCTRIDAMAGEIRGEIPAEQERWGLPAAHWEDLVQELKDFCTGRSQRMIADACTLFRLDEGQKAGYFGGIST